MVNTTKRDAFEYPIGDRIRYFREIQKISTNKLANMAGISQSYLRDIENENKNPTVEVLYQICKALGITLKEFFDDDASQSSNSALLRHISALNPVQKETLLAFLKTI